MQTSTTSAYHTFLDYMPAPPSGIIVPQEVIAPPTTMVSSPREPIRFASLGNVGVNLRNVTMSGHSEIVNGDQLVSLGSNTITICIHWPGYNPTKREVSLAKTGGKLTYRMLAFMVATTVQSWMMNVLQNNIQSTETSEDWLVKSVRFESLWLVELRQISPGQWQPVLSRDI